VPYICTSYHINRDNGILRVFIKLAMRIQRISENFFT
jgi:hypothetical protein